ncbi:uncharacterized protein N7459_000383 [Penicillium hispanicum]|uniref:uncharacterized protein n=1 Tax=Penicillium hispanicum TaxID=1080232 RepID=UPI002540BEA1|nr:uncharacterized protein N7459_000383 [Penicillium hispanicum]KAJ5594175.1 hypothetical protein N7459_000383 [Penicillium hispanicum]
MSSSPTDLTEVFSDESSFYGDDDEQARLEEQAAAYDPEPYWSEIHPRLLSTRQHELQAPPPSAKPSSDRAAAEQKGATAPTSLPTTKRGPKESISSFLSRLPPSKTPASLGPWIWAGGPSERPVEEDVPAFMRKGTDLLHAFEEKSAELRAAHDKSGAKTTAGLTRKLNPLRRELEHNIFAVAREYGVTSGKWMLFPSASSVDSCWKTVVTALEKGDLGDLAKVATDDGSDSVRLICIYTRDFADVEDVKRVLRGLVEVELVDGEARPIYYKCDAFTHLDIKSNNDYGLKASMFSSKDVLSGKI